MKSASLLFGTVALVAAPFCAQAQLYTIQVIAPINGTGAYATSLDNTGRVSGNYNGENRDPFFLSGGVVSFPPKVGIHYPSVAGLADNGAYVGEYYAGSSYHGYVTAGGKMTDLGSLGGNGFSDAVAINQLGQITGSTATNSGMRAFIDENGLMTSLGTLSGGNVSSGVALNDLGNVVGYSNDAAQKYHAFFSSGGAMKDLGTLGGDNSFAADVNDLNEVVGYSDFTAGDDLHQHAFVYENGSIKDLGTFGGQSSYAFAVNESGKIVGSSWTASNEERAFISDGASLTDLNSVVNLNGSGLSLLTSAVAINDVGQIIGDARDNNGGLVSYLLTPVAASPVPEPSTYAIMGVIMLLGLILRKPFIAFKQNRR